LTLFFSPFVRPWFLQDHPCEFPPFSFVFFPPKAPNPPFFFGFPISNSYRAVLCFESVSQYKRGPPYPFFPPLFPLPLARFPGHHPLSPPLSFPPETFPGSRLQPGFCFFFTGPPPLVVCQTGSFFLTYHARNSLERFTFSSPLRERTP